MTDKEILFKEKLEVLIKTTPKSVLANHFGVSRQSFYKWLRKYNIEYFDESKNYESRKIEDLNKKADELLGK